MHLKLIKSKEGEKLFKSIQTKVKNVPMLFHPDLNGEIFILRYSNTIFLMYKCQKH